MTSRTTYRYFKHLPLKLCINCPVRELALCKPLTVEQLSQPRSSYLLIRSKTHLYQQGMSLTETYSVCTGWLLLYRTLTSGKRQVLRVALPGDFLGARLKGCNRMPHAALSLTDCTVCSFPNLNAIARTCPELAAHMAIRYERDAEMMDDYLTHVTQGDAEECIAFLALHLYRCLRLRGLNHGNTIPFPLNQEDIADALGFTVVHINRILHQLRDQGLLKIQKHELAILDYKALCELASLDDGSLNQDY